MCSRNRSILFSLVVAFLAGGVLALPRPAAADGFTYTPIAYVGNPAPGGGTFVHDFEPYINNRGDVAFTADVSTGGEGIFLARNGSLIQVMRAGQDAPGGGVFADEEDGMIGVSSKGDLGFAFTLEPASPLNGGLYRFTGLTQTVSAVVTPNVTPAPDGNVFAGVAFNPALNERGDLVFSAWVSDSGGLARGSFVANKKGTITKVVYPGDAAPGGGSFTRAGTSDINNGGDVSFRGTVTTDASGAWEIFVKRASTGNIEAITTTGQAAPGGGVFVSGDAHHINDPGDVAVTASVDPGTGITIGEIFLASHGILTRVVGPGDPMPGGGNVALLGPEAGGPSQFSLNDRDAVAFNAALDTGDEGLYVASNGVVSLVARNGSVLPGIGTVYNLEMPVIGLPPSGVPTSAAQINNRGQVVFGCTLTDGNVVLVLATPN